MGEAVIVLLECSDAELPFGSEAHSSFFPYEYTLLWGCPV